MNFINHNGKIFPVNQPVLPVSNRGFKYGDGIFETIRFENGKLPLKRLHFERMLSGLHSLRILFPDNLKEKIGREIPELCALNNIVSVGRVRVTVFRDENNQAGYVIEANEFKQTPGTWLEEAMQIVIFKDAVKAIDKFSNLKTCSFLPYAMASAYAETAGYNDALIENSFQRIADSSRANIFIIKNREIITPPLTEGCVAGVMRRFILENLSKNFSIKELALGRNDLETGDEIFLTNALRGISWVKKFGDRTFDQAVMVKEIHQHLVHHLHIEIAGNEG